MKKEIISVFTCAFIFVFGTLLSGCDDNQSPDQPSPGGEDSKKMTKLVSQLKERIEQIEVKQVRLMKTIEKLESRKKVGGIDVGTVADDQIKRIIEEQLASITEQKFSELAAAEIVAHEERKKVEAEAEREKRNKEREARYEEREVARVARMAEELGLDGEQAEQLRIARAGMRETMNEVFKYVREEGHFEPTAIRETITNLRAEHKSMLNEFMTPEQTDTYLQKYSFSGGFGMRRHQH